MKKKKQQPKGGRIYFGSLFQRFLFHGDWLYCFWANGKAEHQVEVCNTEVLTLWQPGSRTKQ
jgi:hypothetical protein